jgi:hypothetical protein
MSPVILSPVRRARLEHLVARRAVIFEQLEALSADACYLFGVPDDGSTEADHARSIIQFGVPIDDAVAAINLCRGLETVK